MDKDARFIAIEIKLAHQEDLVESLNDALYQQGRRLEQLEGIVQHLAEHIRNNAQAGQQISNDRPPHY
jgi:SlyX protein